MNGFSNLNGEFYVDFKSLFLLQDIQQLYYMPENLLFI